MTAAGAVVRPNSMDVDLGAVTHNVAEILRVLEPGTKLFAALKADGYGFGLEAIAGAVLRGGGEAFALVEPAQAVQLRTWGHTGPVLLYGGVVPERDLVSELERHRIAVTVYDLDSIEAYAALANTGLQVFLEIDVGMERLGAAPGEAATLAQAIARSPWLELGGIYTHMHVGAADTLADYLDWQLGRFAEAVSAVRLSGLDIKLVMAASSPAITYRGGPSYDAVDAGHLVYGLFPGVPRRVPLDLRPAFMSLTSRVIQVKELKRGEFRDQLPADWDAIGRLAVAPIGRADGLTHCNAGKVLIRGRACPIVGRLSLEHCRVDVSAVPDAQLGDEVVIIGTQGAEQITLAEVAAAQQTDEVGVITSIGRTIPRLYTGMITEAPV
jgi:alanine racemase